MCRQWLWAVGRSTVIFMTCKQETAALDYFSNTLLSLGTRFLPEKYPEELYSFFSCRAWLLSQLGVELFCSWNFFLIFIFLKQIFFYFTLFCWGFFCFFLKQSQWEGSTPGWRWDSFPEFLWQGCAVVSHILCGFQGSLLRGGPQSQPGRGIYLLLSLYSPHIPLIPPLLSQAQCIKYLCIYSSVDIWGTSCVPSLRWWLCSKKTPKTTYFPIQIQPGKEVWAMWR